MISKIASVNVYTKDDDSHFNELTDEEQDKATAWIAANCVPIQTINKHHTSYGMKHILEWRTNIYMTNNQFKELMLLSGFSPHCINQLNWMFNVGESSPMFKRFSDGYEGLLIEELVVKY